MTEFKLPDLGENIEEAEVTQVLVSEGDVIEKEQNVLELESEKATFELPCPLAGRISRIHVSEGDRLSVGQTLLTVEESNGAPAGADKKGKPKEKAKAKPQARKEEPASEKKEAPAQAGAPDEDGGPEPKEDEAAERREASREAAEPAEAPSAPEGSPGAVPVAAGPATRRLARELGVELHDVAGSSRGGRITEEDVKEHVRRTLSGTGAPAAAGSPPLPDFSKWGSVRREPLNKIAKTAVKHLTAAWSVAPHVTQHDLVDITDLEEARRRFAQSRGEGAPKITMTALAVKASVAAIKAYPKFASSLDAAASELIMKEYVHVGIAVDTENGLLVPVIRDADRKTLLEIAGEITELAQRARDRKLGLDEMQGGCFTITNLGGIGGGEFTPIINYPEVAILGIGRGRKQPVHTPDGRPVERLMLPLSLSYDHRVINGADGARFITKLSSLLADPFDLLAEC